MANRTITAAEFLRGATYTAAELRERRALLTEREWRQRIDAAVRRSLRSDNWSDDDRDEVASALWLDGFQRLTAARTGEDWRTADTPGAAIQRAVFRHFGVSPTEAMTPRRDDAEHSAAAYYGRAGNLRGRMLTRKAAEKRPPEDAEGQTAEDFGGEDDRWRPDVRATARQASPAELSGLDRDDARDAAHRMARRLGLPVFVTAYTAARSRTVAARLVEDQAQAELGLSPDRYRKAREAETRLVLAECDDDALNALRSLTARSVKRDGEARPGVDARAGHLNGAGEWMPARLLERERAKAKRRPVDSLVFCTEDNSRAVFPRKGAQGAAKDRKGRRLADAGERARRREIAERDPAPIKAREIAAEPTGFTLTASQRLMPWTAQRLRMVPLWEDSLSIGHAPLAPPRLDWSGHDTTTARERAAAAHTADYLRTCAECGCAPDPNADEPFWVDPVSLIQSTPLRAWRTNSDGRLVRGDGPELSTPPPLQAVDWSHAPTPPPRGDGLDRRPVAPPQNVYDRLPDGDARPLRRRDDDATGARLAAEIAAGRKLPERVRTD